MKILYVVNNVGFFFSHRLPIALAAREGGNEVMLVTGNAGSKILETHAIDQIRRHQIAHHLAAFSSGNIISIAEILSVFKIAALMLKWKPDLIHCVSPKGILYGGIAARLTRRPALLLAVSGMGSLFSDDPRGVRRLVQKIYLTLARIAYGHRNCCVIVQNTDDREILITNRLAKRYNTVLIPGSGVILKNYTPIPWGERANLVILPARLLREKGVLEFVAAARTLRARGCEWKFALIGTADYDNPSSIPESQIKSWVIEGCIEWWGHQDDMASIFVQTKIVCLPSYREGMPKALLEAAAAGCAVITADSVGCRDAILPGVSGELVPPRDVPALTDALSRLIEDNSRQIAYGRAGRRLAEDRFGLDDVITKTLAAYGQLTPEVELANTRPGGERETP